MEEIEKIVRLYNGDIVMINKGNVLELLSRNVDEKSDYRISGELLKDLMIIKEKKIGGYVYGSKMFWFAETKEQFNERFLELIEQKYKDITETEERIKFIECENERLKDALKEQPRLYAKLCDDLRRKNKKSIFGSWLKWNSVRNRAFKGCSKD
jgi:predicted RNase H-like nuclease (RuvC/YqgF family)